MALKAIIDSLDGLDENVAGFYKAGDGGKFVLQIDALDDHPAVGALRRAKQYEVDARKVAEGKIVERDETISTLSKKLETIEGANGDVRKIREQLEASAAQAVAAAENKGKQKIEKLEANIKRLLVDNVAQQLVADITDYPDLLLPHVQKRLTVDMADGEAVTRVVGPDGSESVLTVDDLKSEFVTNEKYAAIIRASKATGGGATGGSNKGGGAPKKLSEMGDAERAAWQQRDPVGFKKAVDEQRKAGR